MPLNPAVEAALAMQAEAPPIDFASITAAQLRAVFDAPAEFGPPIEMARVEDIAIDLDGRSLPARLYVADDASAPPLTVFFHGGGWVLGTLDTHDAVCRALAKASGSAVLSVAYRLAPEHPYPAAAEDAFDAIKWAAHNGAQLGVDAARMAVAGDSAGGNLAAAAAIMARDAGGPTLRHQLLFYPVTDADFTRPSYAANGGGGYLLSTAMMEWFWALYLGGASADSAPLATILHMDDMTGLPPASIYTAEYDPLRDEGLAYAAKLKEAGVPVKAEDAPGMIHGFANMFQIVPDARLWIDAAAQDLHAALMAK